MTSRDVNTRSARKSALLVGIVLSGIAAWNVYNGRPWEYCATGGAGGVLLAVGALSGRASVAFHKYWMRFAGVLGAINARILLSVMFFLVITPVGLLGRLFGRNTMQRRGAPRDSYWIARERTRQTPDTFERTF